MKKPPRYKTAILIWVAIYPTINIINFAFGTWLEMFPMLIRTLLLTAILVPLMVYVLLPFLNKTFANWLNK
jgi:antibiotic biosynthesis monooxygenase (ABM) superfamily enzyme